MIREIINFTNGIIEDTSDIMQWKVEPSKGLHIFIDIDDNGVWKNSSLLKGIDYDYYDGKNKEITLWNDCIKYQNISDYITMNKVQRFDAKQKIHSCSPFSVAFNFNYNDSDKETLGIKILNKKTKVSKEEKDNIEQEIRLKRIDLIKERLNDYKKNSCRMFFSDENPYQAQIYLFVDIINNQVLQSMQDLSEFKSLTEKDYVRIYFRSFDFETQESLYNQYLENEILNGEKLSGNKEFGALGFLTTFPAKKIFMRHQTSVLEKGVNCRFTKQDALVINNFEKMLKRNLFPNPLPIVIDKREINNLIVKVFNDNDEVISYRDLIKKMFESRNIKYLPDYYLLFYTKTTKGLVFNDFDFVPLFKYSINANIYNVVELKDKEHNVFSNNRINNVFELEQIFNKFFVKYHKETHVGYSFLIGNYFGEKIESQKSFKQFNVKKEVLSNFYKYRKAIYDYIYKSEFHNITTKIFDEIVYVAIVSDIQMDEYKNNRHSKYNSIREKINIWFSLYSLFINNSYTDIMVSKIEELKKKAECIAADKTVHLESKEEFAFCAGQIVSYLLEKSEAGNKSYAMLETFLQKSKSRLLQDEIVKTIAIYKHKIKFYNGKKFNFELLSADVLTYTTDENDFDMKPLQKYFIAGCFCPSIFYNDNNN